MCRPISHRNLARMKLAPLGSGSMVLLGAYRRHEIFGTVDVAHHARVADRNLYQPGFVRGPQMARRLVAAKRYELPVVRAGNAHRVAAPPAKVRRRERRPAPGALAA